MEFTIRDAKPSDSEFIARNLLAAMGYEVFSEAEADPKIEIGSASLSIHEAVMAFGEVCARPDTLNSYTRTRVACVDGRPVGSLTAYSGDDYLPLRDLTWGLLNSIFDGSALPEKDSSIAIPGTDQTVEDTSTESVDNEYSSGIFPLQEPECLPGEFYLDSMAILPEFRGISYEYAGSTDRLGHILMLDGIEQGRTKGFQRISLIVDKAKPRLKTYYSALGFRPDGEILFFGHLYDRMIKDLD